jgi:cell division initiation protein
MFTPQQIEQISFNRATFGGYDMQSVDAVLEPLVDDYITLYKENALLKSKMRVLVGKLEEYRQNEASLKDAIVNAQKTCDLMVKEAENKCATMLNEANLAAAENSRNARALMAEENARVEQAKKVAAIHIDELEAQLRSCIEKLEQIKLGNYPSTPDVEPVVPESTDAQERMSAVADEISQNLANSIGSIEEPEVKPQPMHPNEEPTSKFNGLQFGPKYDPTR